MKKWDNEMNEDQEEMVEAAFESLMDKIKKVGMKVVGKVTPAKRTKTNRTIKRTRLRRTKAIV